VGVTWVPRRTDHGCARISRASAHAFAYAGCCPWITRPPASCNGCPALRSIAVPDPRIRLQRCRFPAKPDTRPESLQDDIDSMLKRSKTKRSFSQSDLHNTVQPGIQDHAGRRIDKTWARALRYMALEVLA